jgi:hypothetical protein
MSQVKVLTDGQVADKFGHFEWKPNGSKEITILGDWIAKNIVSVYISQLKGVPTYGGTFSGKVRWHKDGVEQLQHAWAEIEEKKLLDKVIFWDGSFYPRRKAGGSSLSHHSWGIALDINADWNGFGKTPAAKGKKGSVRELVPIFEKHGFAWGGLWGKPDGMHFEIAQSKDYETSEVLKDALVIEGFAHPLDIILRDGVSYASLSMPSAAVGEAGVDVERNVPAAVFLRARDYKVTWDAANNRVNASKN